MKELAIQIVRCIDDQHQPGWIECEFIDAEGYRHTLVDKVPIFSSEPLDTTSMYPQPGGVACNVLDIWRDPSGRELVRITTDLPWHVESTEKQSLFVVLPRSCQMRTLTHRKSLTRVRISCNVDRVKVISENNAPNSGGYDARPALSRWQVHLRRPVHC